MEKSFNKNNSQGRNDIMNNYILCIERNQMDAKDLSLVREWKEWYWLRRVLYVFG
jgi:hypothetical protein